MQHVLENIKKRKKISLDGLWRFAAHDGDFYRGIPDADEICVPSCWNCTPKYFSYEGVAWYETEIYAESENIRIIFEAVQNECEIYLDGKKIGYHYGGFTEFNIDAFGISKGMHKLCVRVDNTHNDTDTIPLSKCDWFHYGGIARSVYMVSLDGDYIDSFVVKYDLTDDLESAVLNVKAKIFSFEGKETKVSFRLDGEVLAEKTVSISSEETIEFLDIKVDGIRLWDIGRGELYTATIETNCDSALENIGFRKIETRGRDIYLNNRKIKLRGINRHDEHPDWGFSIPSSLIKRDIDLIVDMGCNTIRGSHYPNSRFVLDYCDRKGILFWEEIPLWQANQTAETAGEPKIAERGETMLSEMIRRDIHRPCIILWGLHNEINTTCMEGYELTKRYRAAVEKLDKSRLIAFATSFPLEDICLSLCDVACVNAYLGWYDGKTSDWGAFTEKVRKKLRAENLEIPFVMSEFGAGAIYGTHSFDKQIWSEEFQAELLSETLECFTENDDIAGTYVWQFSDVRSSKALELLRPRNFNNKGILNEYRHPKLAYSAVSRIYREKAVGNK